MTDQIHQIQASYQPLEDRILLNIKTLNQHVYCAWITRRYLQLLLPALHGHHPTSHEPLFDQKKAMLNQLKNEASQLSNGFNQPYQAPEQAIYPLGETPILLAKITFKALDTPAPFVHLEPHSGQGISLPFQPELLGALLKVFGQAMEAADWQLDLNPIMQLPKQMRLQ
ncbi:hypothetical protein [Thiomicrorhabdus aquaedulcis]|uniref:hypothetical protein n=1 Tax=Thiomicrorhabdus aquaedulcis TaxID=2211106 RepID=UPI000FDCB9F5|nr:hypothetical protein [Thiomicrorhabdus aquaedulcis]